MVGLAVEPSDDEYEDYYEDKPRTAAPFIPSPSPLVWPNWPVPIVCHKGRVMNKPGCANCKWAKPLPNEWPDYEQAPCETDQTGV